LPLEFFVGGLIIGTLFLISIPLILAIILFYFARLLKFKKTDFKTALLSVLVIFSIMILLNSLPYIIFFIFRWLLDILLRIFIVILSFTSGVFVLRKYYDESSENAQKPGY